MSRTWTRWTPAHAAAVLRDLDASGLTLAAFARQRDLCPQRLSRWRDKLPPRPAGTARLIELVPQDTVQSSTGSLRIVCPTGHLVELVHVDLDRGLVAVLRALEQLAC